jgi:phosphatidylserine decarboxylase
VKIAPEGIPFVIAGVAVLGGLLLLARWLDAPGWVALPLAWLPVAAWVPVFFRDPPRPGPRGDRLVLAPADGRVVSITEVDDAEAMSGPAVRIAIFMNVFNVHVNRHPVDGTVVRRAYRPGTFVNASLDKASVDNEQMSLGIATPHGPVLVRQIAGLIARRIVTDPTEGETVRQGERLGLIRFGSRVDTFLPPGAVTRVAVGDRTRAGVTVIAEWP